MKTEYLTVTIPVTVSYAKGHRKCAITAIKRFLRDEVVPFEMEDIEMYTAENSYLVKGNKFKINKIR